MNTDPTPIVSRICPDGTLLETIFDPDAGSTALAIGRPNCTLETAAHFDLPEGGRLVPYSPSNNLLTSGCVLLPSAIGELGDKEDVLDAIKGYLARYVDLSPAFSELAPYYVLLTWVYDAFNEMPLIRFRGDYGTGKTRALLTLGSICYKPFFASGASTVSPIFHILDAFRGTLVLDEADFRFSDMTGELTKILNNGAMNGLPVLRTMTNRHKELNPTAFRVFGPKVIAMRESFQDPALESRIFTEETGGRPLPPHVPLNTPGALATDARELRNQLLAWRLRYHSAVSLDASRAVSGAEARLNQMALPLLSLIDDSAVRERVSAYLAGDREDRRGKERSTQEALVLASVIAAFEESSSAVVRVADIADRFNRSTSGRFHIPLSNKAVGFILREKLGISTGKYHGTYGVLQEERERVCALADRLGIPHSLPTCAPSYPQPFAPSANSHAVTETP